MSDRCCPFYTTVRISARSYSDNSYGNCPLVIRGTDASATTVNTGGHPSMVVSFTKDTNINRIYRDYFFQFFKMIRIIKNRAKENIEDILSIKKGEVKEVSFVNKRMQKQSQ